jgi:uncharacterized membrane protein
VVSLAVGAEALAFVLGIDGLVALTERLGSPVCHHDPQRTLRLGRLLPVCARCTGLYLGVALGGPAGVWLGAHRPWLGRAMGTALVCLAIGLVAAVAEALGWIATGNATRLALGLLLGVAVPLVAGLGARVMIEEGRR